MKLAETVSRIAQIEIVSNSNIVGPLWSPEGGPKVLDINPTSRCQLGCICWSENHSLRDGLTAKQWIDTLAFFRAGGLLSVTVTGGEPLLRSDLPDILCGAKNLGLNTTLSTNTLLLPKRAADILPYVDEVGIPIDGSTPESHSLSRPDKAGALSHRTALQSLDILGDKYPDTRITIRTVVSKLNSNDLPNIGQVLESTMGNRPFRWKLYMLTRAGYYSGRLDPNDSMLIARDEYDYLMSDLRFKYPDFNIVSYTPDSRGGRYVIVGTQGRVWGVDDDGITEVSAGNILLIPYERLIPRIKAVVNQSGNELRI